MVIDIYNYALPIDLYFNQGECCAALIFSTLRETPASGTCDRNFIRQAKVTSKFQASIFWVFLHHPLYALPYPLFKPMPESPSASSSSQNGNAVHAIAPSTPSRSSNYSARYHVFINCPVDVVNEFGSLFCYTLTNFHKLKVCFDKDELQNGHILPATTRHAIRTAPVHIAIFSQNYAKSPRCLTELLLMLESRAKIIPFYYNLQPSDLRRMNINMHEEDQAFDPKTIEKWREALKSVSYINGHVFNLQNDSYDSVLNKIVEMVVKEVRNKLPLYVAKHPVGLEKAVDNLDKAIKKSGQQIVGILGPVGVGKTTLVTQFYNCKQYDYQECCFLSDVSKRAKKDLHQTLQCKLIEQLCHTKWDFHSTTEGKRRLTECLKGVQALIIIDAIDHESQLNALLLEEEDYAPHSLIIVTSRDKAVLERSGISFIHEVNVLDAADALKLFCLHAFGQHHPRNGFEYLVKDVLTECEGLPLSLKIYGESFNKSNDQQNWNVSEAFFEINDNLKSSYDTLTEEEKEIFLWCASCSVETDKGTAIGKLDELGLNGSYGLETLEQKCLIECNDKNCLKMSNHLRDLGRHIKHEWPLKDSHKGHCPCHPKDTSDLMKQQSGAMEVRGPSMTEPLDRPRNLSDSQPQVTWCKCWMHVFGSCFELGCCCCCCSAHATS